MLSQFGIETMDRTTPNHRNGVFLGPRMFTMLLGVGTGGDYTPSYHLLRSEKGAFRKPRQEKSGSSFAISVEIEYTKSTLNLTMSELARCLGVSRQAIYNWIAGAPIKQENLAK